MQTFTNCAEKKAKQFLNLLQGYTKGIRLTAILILLLMGVSNVWAASTVQGGHIYFDELNSGYTGAGDMQFWVGHNSYSCSYSMSKIDNTKLWYCTAPNWSDATYFAFTSGANWGSANQKYYDRIGSNTWKSAIKENYALDGSSKLFVFRAASTANKAAVISDSPYGYQGTSYTSLNKTITIKAKVSTNGGSSYSEASTPAKLTGSSKVFTSTSSCTGTSGASATLNAGSSSTTFKAGYTANTTLTAVVATGYTFAGWYSGSTKVSDNLTVTVNPTGETTYYAYYKKNQHTVTYGVHNSGNGSISAKAGSTSINSGAKVNHGSQVIFTASPSTGYRIQGWYSDANCTTSLSNGTNTTYTISSLTAAATVYVKYEEIPEEKFAVTIQPNNANYGTVSPSGSQQVGASGIEIEATAKYGYKFDQWTKTGSITIDDTSDPTTVIKAAGTGTVTATFVEDLATTKWYISGNGNGSGDDLTPGSPFTGWATNGIQMFKKSGHSTEEIYYCTITANTIASSDDHFPFKVYNATTSKYWGNSGYWVTKENNSPTLSSSSGNNMKFRPYLVGTYEFKLDATNASSPVLTVTWPVYNQLRISAANPADATNTGEFDMTGSGTYTVTRSLKANTTYTFKIVYNSDWYGANSGNLTRASSTKTLSTSSNDLTLKTDFAGDYTFTFNSNTKNLTVTYPTAYTLTYGSGAGGSGTVTADNSIKSGDLVLAGTSVTLTADPADGYDFAAWYSDQACEGDVVSSNNPYNFSINSNTTLYAKWKAQSFELTWDLNGGRITIDGTPQGPVAVGTTLVAPTVEKDYYDFESWNPTVPKTMPAADVTYTAQWTPKKYDITYKDQGDKEFSGTHANGYPTTHTYNTTTTLLGATKSGYTFAGWYRDSECAGARVETLGVDITEAITLYAKWDVASYTINFDPEGGTGGTTTELTVPFGAQLPNITIPTKAGYLFLGYYDGDNGTGTQYYDASGKGVTTMPANNLTLHAKWLNGSDCIFFYNNLGWSNVYVYFYNNADGHNYWADGYGTGANKQQKFWENNPYYEMEHGTMTQIKGTNIWYYYATYIKTNQRSKVSFANVNQSCDKEANNTNSYFQNAKVVYRADLDYEKRLPMFVPHTTQSHYFGNTKSTYYNHGYWMNYPENTGYKLHIFDENGNKINDQLVEIPFEYGDNTIMPWSVSVSLEGATTYAFKIQRADNQWYGNNGTMTTGHSGDAGQTAWEFTTGTNNCKITTTAPGTYVFTLNYGQDRNSNYNYLVGVEYPASVEDYRLAYKDNTHPFHPGHLLKKRAGSDIVSFFVHYNENPVIMLQQVTAIDANTGAITWETLKTYALTANQPANEDPGQAMIPGRRNADEVILHIGDEHMDGIDATGIYNFVLEQTDSEATLQNTATKYTGNFYIRTDATAGGWGNFRQKSNQMTYTSYAENQGFDFNHYFVKWINAGTNVKFTIANDYSYCLSDSLDADDIVTTGNLPANANVRFGWNSKTNELTRAYIAGSSNASDRFLVLTGNEYLLDIAGESIPVGTGDRDGLNEHELIFSDKQNWIYQLDVQANSNTEITLTAQYNGKVQTFFGTSKSGFGGEPIMQATNDDYHKVRMIYDFKTNNLIAAWLLDETQYPETKEVTSNMLIIREDQGVANQINFSKIDNDDMKIQTAYAVMTFTKDWVTGAATRDRSEYWVSFPFDVKISDVFGFSEYGDQWIMQLYDGAERAEKGNWIDSPTFWKYITNRNYTLKAGVGYVLKLNPSKMTFDHGVTDVSLFFPSQGIPTVINAEPTPITVPPHECTIERDYRNIRDSHWNLIGVPGYANLETVNTSYTTGNQAGNVSFYYAYNAAENKYAPAAAEATFKNMYAYMVQFAGTIDWKNDPQFNNIPQQLAARHNSETEPEKRTLRLEIAQGEEVADQTFVQLQQEGATPEFDMNLDLTKIINSGANIYTLAGDARIQVAGNALPVAETTIPVGVQMATAGEYTFRMPDGTDGIIVELIDYETNTRTNLLLSDYTTTLPQGICENRFALSVKPDKVATDVEHIGEDVKNSEAAKKYIIDGKLFLQKNGMLYDAQGHIVR